MQRGIHCPVWARLVLALLPCILLAVGCFKGATDSEPGGRNAAGPADIGAAPNTQPSGLVEPGSEAPRIGPVAEFAGNTACANCHPAEYKDYVASRHASTIRLADRASLGSLAPLPGALPGTRAKIVQNGSGYQVVMPPPHPASGPLQYAIGSGKSGITFVTVMGDNLFEMRASYFPHLARWKVTPGQHAIVSTALGVVHRGSEARRCMLCHVTTLPADSPIPDPQYFGVGCESCHGPAGAHVAAKRAGKSGITMERLGAAGGKRIVDLCGTCHRSSEVAGIAHNKLPDLSVTARFQSYALGLSRCFKESGLSLSCNTCHNPHKNAATDTRSYENACLRCHAEAASPRLAAGTVHGKVCPVNARSGCIGCHMPAKKMLPNDADGLLSADHFIRIVRTVKEK